jgi:protein TonB
LKHEQLISVIFVMVLHGVVFYVLWNHRIIPTPDETYILVSNFVNPPTHVKPPQPKPPKPLKSLPPDTTLPERHNLVAEVPVVLPDEPVGLPPPPEPVIEAPAQPLVLTSELSVNCPDRQPPEYPPLSNRMNEQGKVVLRVELGEDGRVANTEVKTSSGYRRLDDAALNAVMAWRCKPAVRNGVAVRAVALQPFKFTLEGR